MLLVELRRQAEACDVLSVLKFAESRQGERSKQHVWVTEAKGLPSRDVDADDEDILVGPAGDRCHHACLFVSVLVSEVLILWWWWWW